MCLPCSGCPNLTKKRTELSGEVMLVEAEFILWSHLSIHVGLALEPLCVETHKIWHGLTKMAHVWVSVFVVLVHSLGCIWFFEVPWAAACQASLSFSLLEFAQTRVHWVSDAIRPFHPVTPFYSCPQSFPASESFPVSWLFASNGLSINWSFSFIISPSNEYSGLASFRTD